MKYFKRLRSRHWAWLNFLFGIGLVWPIFMLVTPPELITGVLDPVIYSVIMGLCFLGTLLTMYGYFASQQIGRIGVIGVSLELAGLILSVLGPAAYLVTRVYLLFQGEPFASPLFFAYALCAVYLHRFVIVVPRFRFEAHDPTKE